MGRGFGQAVYRRSRRSVEQGRRCNRYSRGRSAADTIVSQYIAKDDSDKTIDLNKGYTPNGFAAKVFHLHIKPYGDCNELYFRDYLREHSDVARPYETLKLSIKEKYENNRDAYTEAKTDFIIAQTQKVREEFDGLYLPRKSL